ncbi:pyridoxamine 5'-phosphate oxidase family protein [Krasilnikoviella flava]|uniref:General stress protein 26 n=1 Tax=Krasilnikoviella flava TaxID=526729 RepID=A0A1T5L5H3_9MICO|nr:pyridoxamine 5'-phosphate oxidase family protein [Krasilnikoviella flava]SKC71194.1 General stress protein 26 [Krasilnikoviella flava]
MTSRLSGAALERMVEHVRAVGDGVVSTLGPDGGPQSAYLTLAVTATGELVFDARAGSRKVANLRRDPRVAVVVGGPGGTTLQAEGLADEPTGADRERCAEAYGAAFPRFAASLTDPGIVVVRVAVHWARWGDFRISPPVVEDLVVGERA